MKSEIIRIPENGEPLYRLIAEPGKLLVNGNVGLAVVETYAPTVWYEVDNPGDDRYNEATIEDYREKLAELGVQL